MTDLSPTELHELRVLSGTMIPPSAEFGLPGADDPIIQSDIARSIGRDLPLVREALQSFRAGQDINAWYTSGGKPATTLGRAILWAYYRDDRVLVALGHEARAPFPKGHVVEQGDWSLVDVVRQRKPFWRDDRAGGR